jgi:hypothetical protein
LKLLGSKRRDRVPWKDYALDFGINLAIFGHGHRYCGPSPPSNSPRLRTALTRIILAHAGGFLPYASHRFAELARVFRPDAADPADILASFQRFYFDTALSSGPAALPSLTAFAGSGRILFGSDFPYAPAGVAASFTAKLDAYDGLTADEHGAISYGNAWTLFPLLAPQYDTALPERRSVRSPR